MSETNEELIAEYERRNVHRAYWGLNEFTDKLIAAIRHSVSSSVGEDEKEKDAETVWEYGIWVNTLHGGEIAHTTQEYAEYRRERSRGPGPWNLYRPLVVPEETVEAETEEPFWTCPTCGKESEDGEPETHICWGAETGTQEAGA